MQTAVRIQSHGDFSVALQALECGLAAELMAGGTMTCALQGPVRARQRPGGYLSACGAGCQAEQDRQQKSKWPRRSSQDLQEACAIEVRNPGSVQFRSLHWQPRKPLR